MVEIETGQGPLSARFAKLRAQPQTGPVAADPASLELLRVAARAAATDATILVTGPSGAGKEVMARHIHDSSPRAGSAFIAVNCAALPEAMLESLLFGHQRGAFTGAEREASGLFRAAHGGTLFLDELGELPLALQSKLLRAIEQGEVLPLGATTPVPVDVRLVAATNRDLPAEVAAGRFRADLYWRLAVFPLALLPLAARPADILPLAAALEARAGRTVSFSEDALARLVAHEWPGNVRELANVLQRASILADAGRVEAGHICFDVGAPGTAALPQTLRQHETSLVRRALAESDGRRREAARRLGISERALRYKLAAEAGRPRAASRTAMLQ
ncbi:sigma-54 interaction domain-containing protein [Sandaracinobacteroides hominis]|uniref:sigma-54 interaction domain-containing protein n=1 Tax=Sandaracinobacteroides hominis TaxID=2780086 RepID=UPI001F487648|nr:sigma-54 dependent transcriptional regulator [Sandaracinobacteroides hominis]